MNSDFENLLQRQPMREIPPQWRGRILAGAQPSPAGWRAWFWPCPQAWAALGATWIIILGLNVGMGKSADQPERVTPAVFDEARWKFGQHEMILAGFNLGADVPPAEPPKPRLPNRSELQKRDRFV